MAPRGSRQDPNIDPVVRRIRADFKASKKRPEYGMGMVYLGLARRWQRPVSEIKRLVRGPKMRNIITVRIK